MDAIGKAALSLHRKARGKIGIRAKVRLGSRRDLSLAYTPGVAEASLAVARDAGEAYKLTGKWNNVAIVTDGSAVLGLGDIGPEAALPVMEGKAVLFKEFGGVDAFPVCLKTKDVGEIVDTVARISPVFGAINLEDISAPRCFEVERKLKERLEIPVMHDDQWATAVVVLAGLRNALKLAGKRMADVKIVVNGAGAAGTAVSKLLLEAGAKNIILCDRGGIVDEGSFQDDYRGELVGLTNPANIRGRLEHAMKKADALIGVSAGNVVNAKMVGSMGEKPIVFALANPVPEIMPAEAREGGAFIIATGRSDFPNQVNNALAFPGIFRGLLDSRAMGVGTGMLLSAAEALAGAIPERRLRPERIIPSLFDKKVVKNIAEAVGKSIPKK